jgi:3-carboxy-cis,cis-muconate cycloisomerase
LFSSEAVAETLSDTAWLAAILAFESALARAESEAGLIPSEHASAISSLCESAAGASAPNGLSAAELGREALATGTPVVPLLSQLRARLPEDVAEHLHFGATSQDALDSAAMLVSQRALGAIVTELDGVAASCARLAEEHRDTPMAGRTLLQRAVPTTFGLKAAGWLDAVLDARVDLISHRGALPAQLGGATGNLAALGEVGPRVAARLAELLDLAEPRLPWHTARGRVARLGSSLAIAAQGCAKIGLDIELMAQSEVGEVAEDSSAERGASSAMPHKRNPVGSVLAVACGRRAVGAAATLIAAVPQEHERAAGSWHAEWRTLCDALGLAGGAAARVGEALAGLRVDPKRMRANLETGEPNLRDQADLAPVDELIDRALARHRAEVAR